MTADPLVGFENEDLRFERLLGRGAMGAVYRGVQLANGRTVAIKIIAEHLAGDPEHRVRFAREGQTLRLLSHPHIVACHFVGATEGPDGRELFVMVLEYVEGWTLGSLLRRGVLTVRRTLDLHRQVAEALAYAHDNGIIHRDIKPENILVTRQGEAKVADFGLAKLTDATLLTTTGVILGSPAYMSPEACQAQTLTPASDLYSLGCSLYHCLTGRLPYPAGSSLQMLNLHVTAPVPVLSQVRPDLSALDELIQRLLAKHPLERHADGRIVAQILQTVVRRIPSSVKAGQPMSGSAPEAEPAAMAVTTPATGSRPQDDRGGRRIRLTLVTMGAVVVLVLALVWVSSSGRQAVAVVNPVTVREQFTRIAERIAMGRADDLEQAGWQLDTIRQLGVALPEDLRGRVPGLEQAIAQGWTRIRDGLDRQLAAVEDLVRTRHFEDAMARLKEMEIPARFPEQRAASQAVRARIVAAVPDIEADVQGRTWVLTDNDGVRPPVGSLPEVPGSVPGGCGRVVVSRSRAGGQQMTLVLPGAVRSAAGDGLAVVLHARTERSLEVQTPDGRRLAGCLLEGRDWQVVRLPLGQPGEDGRLVLTMSGTEPFVVAKVVYGRGILPGPETLGVSAGTLVPPLWTGEAERPGFREWLVRCCRQHPNFPDPRRLVLARWGGAMTEREAQALLQRIDRAFAPDAGDLSSSSRVLTWAELLAETKRTAVKGDESVQIVVIPVFIRPDPSREELEALRRGLQLLRLRGVLPVVVWRSQEGTERTSPAPGIAAIRGQWPGLPFIDLDRVVPFLADNHLGSVDQAQIDAGLAAGFSELAERIRWAVQEGGVGTEALRRVPATGAAGK